MDIFKRDLLRGIVHHPTKFLSYFFSLSSNFVGDGRTDDRTHETTIAVLDKMARAFNIKQLLKKLSTECLLMIGLY